MRSRVMKTLRASCSRAADGGGASASASSCRRLHARGGFFLVFIWHPVSQTVVLSLGQHNT